MATKQVADTELDEKDRDDEQGEDEEDEREERRAGGKDEDPVAKASADLDRDVKAGPGSFIRNVWTITRREVRSYFDSLIAYVVIGLSMLIVGVWIFMPTPGFWENEKASMGRMFDPGVPFTLPWLIAVIVIPLVTMRSISEEKRSGTIELLITLPVRDSEVILGKYFAALLMVFILLVASILYPLMMFVWPWHLGPLDWGPIWSAYLGLFFLSLAGVAVGMVFSSITESQIIAFFVSAIVMLGLMAIGSLVESAGGWVGEVLAFISFQSRYASFAKGLIDTRAIVYFLSITVVGLLISFRSLESRKWK